MNTDKLVNAISLVVTGIVCSMTLIYKVHIQTYYEIDQIENEAKELAEANLEAEFKNYFIQRVINESNKK
jgi:hypothetical protein